MSIYSTKQKWKLLLAIAAMLIVFTSLWYTNIIVSKIADEEEKKVRLWAEAIQKKASLVSYTSKLFDKLAIEERNKMEVWSEATKLIGAADGNNLTFYSKILEGNTNIPVMIVDQEGNIDSHRNFDFNPKEEKKLLEEALKGMKNAPIDITARIGAHTYTNKVYYKDSKLFSELKDVLDNLIESFISEVVINSASVPVIYTDSTQVNVLEYGNLDDKKVKEEGYFEEIIAEMKDQNDPIEVVINERAANYIFYKDSALLQQLRYYPFFQFLVIGIFLVVAYYLFSTSRKSEQNQVWIGMAKETAHQLGTPLSSLIAWVEHLKTKGVEDKIISELTKDTTRLEMITERFSKIGAAPTLQDENLNTVTKETLNYLKPRISKKVSVTLVNKTGVDTCVKLNPPLFSWVLENLIKNAVDAMKGDGNITIEIVDQTQFVYMDITDTGSGILKSNHKTIFDPGHTTKKRGWGLGLSLAKRIIENYHFGKIFVKHSDPSGTTFRIVLNK